MFGFGLFSTHLPYLVMLTGYIVCWLWSAQNSPNTADAAQSEKTVEAVRFRIASDDVPAFHPFSVDFTAEAYSNNALQPVVGYTQKAPLPFLCNSIDQGRKTFVFLRPPPDKIL